MMPLTQILTAAPMLRWVSKRFPVSTIAFCKTHPNPYPLTQIVNTGEITSIHVVALQGFHVARVTLRQRRFAASPRLLADLSDVQRPYQQYTVPTLHREACHSVSRSSAGPDWTGSKLIKRLERALVRVHLTCVQHPIHPHDSRGGPSHLGNWWVGLDATYC